jgi:protein-S-isoprenylcysteine O-methyltransferase Ste14
MNNMRGLVKLGLGIAFLLVVGYAVLPQYRSAIAVAAPYLLLFLAQRFASEGLYSVIRHPQYTVIMLAVFGQIVHWPTIITVALFPVIVLVYVLLARKEEKDMINRFGAPYEGYMQRVPRFFPRRGEWRQLFSALRT